MQSNDGGKANDAMRRRWRALLLGVALLSCATASAADLLVHNVNGYTLGAEGKLPRFSALLVDHRKGVATGTDAELASRGGAAHRVDGGGRTLLPGLIDAHGHVMGLGFVATQLDLSGTKTLADALAATKEFAAQHADAAWIRGRGWNQAIWKLGRFPTAQERDA